MSAAPRGPSRAASDSEAGRMLFIRAQHNARGRGPASFHTADQGQFVIVRHASTVGSFMRPRRIAAILLVCGAVVLACVSPGIGGAALVPAAAGTDPGISAFIGKIRAVDNHSHANSVAPGDSDYDALPLDGIPIEMPAQLRIENPDWIAAYKALYQYPYADLSDAHMKELRGAMQRVAKEQGERFPTWVLDQIGTEVLFANRVAMGPGLTPPRFRWVSYVDALLLPLSTKAEAAGSPDREVLYPLEAKHLRRYMSDLTIAKRPATLDAYLKTVVTPTL